MVGTTTSLLGREGRMNALGVPEALGTFEVLPGNGKGGIEADVGEKVVL